MSIQDELNQIKSAVYGSDVRDAIHDSIKKTYDDASANGNANMEVEMARGTEPTLNDRLGKMDDKDESLTAQLEHNNKELGKKPNRTETGWATLNILTEEERAKLLGLAPGEINAVLGERNVMPFNTTFFKHGKNLYNKETAHPDTSISTFSGNLASNEGYVSSDYIKIDPSKEYAISPNPADIRVAFYDGNFENIAETGLSDPDNPVTPPEESVYLRFSTSIQTRRQLEEGSSPTAFEPYTGYYYDEGYIREGSITPEKLGNVNADIFEDNSLTPDKMTFFKAPKNLYNKETAHPGTSISTFSGNLASNEGYVSSDYIPVEPETHYSLSPYNANIRVAFYYNAKENIAGTGLSDPTSPILTPVNAAFVRYSYAVDDVADEDVRQFEKGEVATSYEPHYTAAFDVDTIRDGSIPLGKLDGVVSTGGNSSDDIIVDMRPTSIYFHIKGTNEDSDNYLKYRFTYENRPFDGVSNNRNLDAWRLRDLFEVKRTSDFTFEDVYSESLTTDGVWEFALKEDGQPQFMGGAHGNEVLSDVFVLFDGVEKELGTTEKFKCKTINFVQKTTLYRVLTETPVAETVKMYEITANDGIKLTTEIEWVESLTLRPESYLPMLPIKRTLSDDTQITDTFFRDAEYRPLDVTTQTAVNESGASELKSNVSKAVLWGQESKVSAEIQILERPQIETESMYITSSSLYNKFYYMATGALYTTDIGEKWKSVAVFKLNTSR